MTELIINNIAPIMFVSLIALLLLGYPVSFSLAACGIGYGLIGAQHVETFKKHDDMQFVGVCDAYEPRVEAGLKACGNPDAKGYKDFRDLLARCGLCVEAERASYLGFLRICRCRMRR